jgi:hypothetical protein
MAQKNVSRRNAVRQRTAGVRFKCGKRGGYTPQPECDRQWKLESVTLARLAALGI